MVCDSILLRWQIQNYLTILGALFCCIFCQNNWNNFAYKSAVYTEYNSFRVVFLRFTLSKQSSNRQPRQEPLKYSFWWPKLGLIMLYLYGDSRKKNFSLFLGSTTQRTGFARLRNKWTHSFILTKNHKLIENRALCLGFYIS